MTLVREHDWAPPTRADAVLFQLKALAFRLERLARDALAGPWRLPRAGVVDFPHCVAVSRTPLWAEVTAPERALQRGKVQNLRVAARHLDGTLLAPGAVFSFWKQLGRASRLRGFARGRMLREGCIVPATGGGLCQLSNALYDMALTAGCEIVERHAHSRRVPGSRAAQGRDATVAWNYVDLRFRSARPLLLCVRLDAHELIVELRAPDGEAPRATVPSRDAPRADAESCETCDETACFRHGAAASEGRKAWLVDEFWPEFDAHIAAGKSERDLLCLPLDGKRWRRPQYGWTATGFGAVRTATLTTLVRALRMRGSAQGPRRRMLELRAADALARRFAAKLDADVTELCVTQALLSALWRGGHLGGRTFSVLMTRLPMAALQARLDEAARRHLPSARPWPISAPTRRWSRPRAKRSPPPRASSRRTPISRPCSASAPCCSIGRRCRRASSTCPARAASPSPAPPSRARARTRCAMPPAPSTSKSSSWAARWKAPISGAACARRATSRAASRPSSSPP